MAARNRLFKPTHRFFPENPVISDSPSLEFDESDLWNSPPRSHEPKKPIPSSRTGLKKPAKRAEACDRAASSLPVNIPDWSKILREDYRDSRRGETDADSAEDDEDGDGMIPPHEFLAKQLARTRIASFSVHEGIGRTLKGRDLSTVRNAIWEKTGFQD